MSSGSQPRRLRADAARNRQALIDAAQRLFAARGLAVTLDEIAAEAGVNVATAYRHFANKHELAATFLQQKIDQAAAIAQEAIAVEDPWEGLCRFLERALELMVANRDLHDVFTPGYAAEWLEQLDERVDPLLGRLIAAAQRAGALRPDIEAGDLGVILQMLATVTDIPTGDQSTLLRRYLELILAGLRPADTPLPGTPPTPAEAREGMTPRRRPGGATGRETR
ncbi:MAG TPA: TetR family transcriptional regulator [Solirubrobacteraceae bacterium]|nr:TetR family transcriptional regulator [Solirubrobacteraceae bacterium]